MRLAELKMQAKELVVLGAIKNQSALNKIYERNSARRETLEKIANALKMPVEELTGEFSPKNEVRIVRDYKFVDLPFVPVSARASFINSVIKEDTIVLDKFSVLITDFSENLSDNFVFEVDGDSMEPAILPKSKVRVKPIPSNDWEFIPSGIYLVLYRDEYLVLKRVKTNQMQITGAITLYSDNEETGGSLALQKKDINNIWRVLRIVDAPIR